MVSESQRKSLVNAVAEILPLDQESCLEMVNYTLTLPESQIESHLLDLLGHSEASFSLIQSFLQTKSKDNPAVKKESKKELHKSAQASTLPPRGNKQVNVWGKSEQNAQKSAKGRLSGTQGSATVSQLADIKPGNVITGKKAQKLRKKNLDSLADIESALNELEVEKAQSAPEVTDAARRVCNCMATKHALFEVAPNCLNCGKIICSKEGLQPCSYCGHELLSVKEKREIIGILKSEKELLETKRANPVNKSVQDQPSRLNQKKIKYGMTPGGNLWKAQDEALKLMEEQAKKQRYAEAQEAQKLKEIEEQEKEFEHYQRSKESNPDLMKAQERLETLLHFQDTGAERSKIIDNASDFEMPGLSSGSIWLSPVERALQLKKQQKQLRKIEHQEKSRTGRTKKVVEMVIKDGKVKMIEKHIVDENPTEDLEIGGLEDDIKQSKMDQEVLLAKYSWDYEKEIDKWERPKYVSTQTWTAQELMLLKSRVQQAQLDSSELVTAMPS